MTLFLEQIIRERFRVISKIGSGNFSEVYKVEDLQTQQICALKRFTFSNINLEAWNKAQELFLREINFLRKFTPYQKPFLPQYIDHWEDENKQDIYLVESFIEGKTLKEKINNEGNLTPTQVISLLKKVLEGLIFLHSHDVVHRDIKPDNLIFREEDEGYVIVDFGAAKQEMTELVPFSGTRIYTPGYAPPEQEQGNPQKNSDIYGLGITAIEALIGLSPAQFKNYNITEILHNRYQAIDTQLENLIIVLKKMTDENYQSRYQSADAVLQDLENINKTQFLEYIATHLQITPVSLSSRLTLMILAIATVILVLISAKILVKPTPHSSPSPNINCGPFRFKGEICPQDKK